MGWAELAAVIERDCISFLIMPVTHSELVGSATNNSTAALTGSGQHHHEGHSGYRIDQIDGNLIGLVSSGTGV